MQTVETPTANLAGSWRDVIRDPSGKIVDRSEVRANAIVTDCRRILAAFMAGAPSLGIQGVLFGSGLAAWDIGGPPPASPAQTALADQNPFLVPAANLQIDFLDNAGTVSGTPTNRIQIIASLGPGEPPWPDANHVSGSLREFGLAGELDGAQSLINYVTHPVINKDAASTLERTLWLVF